MTTGMKWFLGTTVSLFVLMVGMLGVWAVFEHAEHTREAARLQPRMSQYTSMPRPDDGPVHRGVPRGKMVLIDIKEFRLDELHFSLYPSERARTSEEVETVVWLRWDKEKVAPYSGGGHACRHLCTVSVFDFDECRLLAQRDFRGGDPPEFTNTPAGSDDYGSKPEAEIRTWLEELRGR